MIVCAMIVGPGEGDRYLARTLEHASTWADHIVIVKDHVDEHTEAVIAATEGHGYHHRARVWSYGVTDPLVTFRADESQVRNMLLGVLDSLPSVQPGDLIVVLDADEELRAGETPVRTALERLHADEQHGAWSALFLHLWNREGTHYRADGGWMPMHQYRVYRHERGARIEQRALACTAIPAGAGPRSGPGELVIAHWGYAREDDRYAKHARYMEIDGGRFHNPRHLASILDPAPVLQPVS